MNWETLRFDNFITLQRGFDLPETEMVEGEVPVLGSNCIIGFHNIAKVDPPGVITGRSGTLGQVQFVDKPYWPHNTALWVRDFKGNSPRFVYYKLQTLGLDRFSSGASVPTLNRNNLDNISVKVPPPQTQIEIASILSVYDDLIENNRRRMALLEEAASLLYQEWFNRLRFPDHEHTKISDGIPEGWERRPIAALCESIDYGYTASAEQEVVGPKFLRITDIVPEFIDWSNVPHCEIEENRLDKFRLLEGDIVVARTGATVGYAKRLNKRHPEAVFASYLVRFRLKEDIDNLMVGTFVESPDYKAYVQSRVGGAAQPNANAQVLAAAEMLVPTESVQRDFRQVVEPLIDQREILQIQNEKLRAARDLLLPRLMSGEIEV